ncbi:hypothetical protein AOLI_G00163510 [Acnodon oligacanthus]
MGEARDRAQNKLAAERKRLPWPVNKTESLIGRIPRLRGHVLQSSSGPPCSEARSCTIGGIGFLFKPDMKGPEPVLTADGRGL